MFAAFTEHLGTALVSLNVDATHGTLLDGSVRVTVGEASAEKTTNIVRTYEGHIWL